MIEIIEGVLKNHDIGGVRREKLKYTLDRASIKKEEGALSIEMTLNFVMPIKARNEIKNAISDKLNHKINDVKINFFYRDIILEKEEAVKLFLP